jgi:hypothetical protein
VRECWYCGRKFDGVLSSGAKAALCDECFSTPITDGSTESASWAYALARLQDHEWTDEEVQVLADSSLGAWLAEEIVKHMDRKCLAQLMRKCVEPLTEANTWL